MLADVWGDLGADVTLPAWAVGILVVAAAWAILKSLLVPSVRWALRRRANRAIAELNERLQIHIQPFKVTRRKVLIERLLFDPEVLSAIDRHATQTGISRDEAMAKAAHYVREIVPSFSAYTYFKVGARLARKVSQALYRVRLGYVDEAALKRVPPDASVVFVINHRSNLDYILMTYVASTTSAMSYAVGEWAQVWGLRGLIRSMGAYFVRRNSNDPLYRRVLARYVDTATKAGVVQAIFPEGGLTRDGRLRPPKLGLLAYIVQSFDPAGERDVVFIPVGINYDRVLEDRVQIAAATTPAGESPRFAFNPLVLLGFVARNLWLLLRGNWHRYGYAGVSFGTPLSLREHVLRHGIDFRTLPADLRAHEVEALGAQLMEAVGRSVPALPVAVAATVLLDAGTEPQHVFEIKGRAYALMTALEQRGAQVHIPRADRDYAIEVGLRMLRMRHLVEVEEETYRIVEREAPLLRYYANSIAHLIAQPTSSSATIAPPRAAH